MQEKSTRRRVILVTDGDKIAQKAVEEAAGKIGGRCISASAGNPTPLKGEDLVQLIKTAPYDPVVVMFDDRGSSSRGKGEEALAYVAKHPDIEVMGVLAVASNTEFIEGVAVDLAVTNNKEIVEGQVDKEGNVVSSRKIVMGDTVDVINEIKVKTKIPLIVGIGDLGKMEGADNPCCGAQVTTKALQLIVDHWQRQHGDHYSIGKEDIVGN